MKKIIAAILLTLMVSCSSVQTSDLPPLINVSLVCKTEAITRLAYNASIKYEESDKLGIAMLMRINQCLNTSEIPVQVPVIQVLEKTKDWENDDMYLVLVRSPAGAPTYGIYWPSLQVPGTSATR